MRFSRRGQAVHAKLDQVEAQVLTQLATELLELVEAPQQSDDPLAALVGLPPGEVHPPDNPVLERLLPAAYGDDPAAASEFRKYTDGELRNGKRQAAKAVLDSLPPAGGRLTLDRDQADAWLSSLNDMRLALGTALEVTEDTGMGSGPDPDADPNLAIYHWLGYLQESLLSCLEPRTP